MSQIEGRTTLTAERTSRVTGIKPGLRKAVLYTRVSSEEQREEGYSIQAQTKLLQDYALKQNYEIVREFSDVETAKRPGRKAFNELIDLVRLDPACKIILVEKTDRLYRNIKDWVTLDPDEMDVEIHLVKENCILKKGIKSSEKFIHGIRVLMAKNTIDNLSEETRKGMNQKAEEGMYPSCAPLGYLNTTGKDKRKYIAPDGMLAPLVAKLFEWASTGEHSLRSLVKLAYDHGLVSKKGKSLARSAVHKVLSDPIYYGDFRWNGRLYSGKHQPVVSKELWDRVQLVLKDRHRPKKRHGSIRWPLQGLIKCSLCGCSIVAELQKGHTYYHCSGMRSQVRARCENTWVREEKLFEILGNHLLRLRFDEEVVALVKDALLSSHDEQRQIHASAVDALQRQYDRLQQRIERMYLDKLDGQINAEFFAQKSTEWRRDQTEVLAKIQGHQTVNTDYMREGVVMLELAQDAHAQWLNQDSSEKRELVKIVYSNLKWNKGELEVEFRQPFDLLVVANGGLVPTGGGGGGKTPDFEKWLPGEDSNLEPCG